MSVEEQLAIIRRGVEQIVPEEELRQKLERSLRTGQPLRIKYGIDPTGIDVHLGHTVPLRKLRQFQELGHQAVIILGNYTALVGDPSGRDQARTRLSVEQVERNARDYLEQIRKVIDLNRAEVVRNGDWFSRFRFVDVLNLCSQMTVQRLLERDDFTKRLKAGTPIYLHECLYPLMQGYDSVAVRSDVELGGSEQLFSLMVGRDLQRDAGQEPQVAITLPILRGLDGVRRMGKSLGNYIGVNEPPFDQFAKVMSIPDDLMPEWFTLLTDRSAEEIARLTDPQRTHPKWAKMQLARDIVGFFHGVEAAEKAAAEWERRLSHRQDPTEIPEVSLSRADVPEGKVNICRLLTRLGLTASNSEARRLVQQGGVNVGPERTRISDPNLELVLHDGLIVRIGNRKIVRIRWSNGEAS
ncbi:MAG: tyrosine--tRNA ligase [Gemmatales bacterium]|nr:tyrosine--tRNA ligase [Gemmatales bacterium]MCS7160058.1 tyrosine--tRNA ligase [Gemmatales bacterium]MDW8175258.1 tyrosine--tRNA ligase [Gemmatales bacterium]MDW8222124.1 tyrosine--tRNA ligase [Gemmatales bacterium]